MTSPPALPTAPAVQAGDPGAQAAEAARESGIPAPPEAKPALGDVDEEASGPRYTVSAVARRLGVAPATLRTWARRYGLGPTEHTSGAHRRYTSVDVDRLRRMRRLTLEGVPPAEAARLALEAGAPGDDASDRVDLPDVRGRAADDRERAGSSTTDPSHGRLDESSPESGAPGAPSRTGGPGGRVLALPSASPPARGLARAAMALDDDAVARLLRERLSSDGVVVTWQQVLAPVLVAVGQRWAATGEGVDVEHLLSECASGVFREAAVRARPGTGKPVLLACAEDDQHALPLHVLAAGLAEHGVASRVLGPAVPTPALVSAVRRTGPVGVFIWSQVRATADPGAIVALPAMRPPVRVVVGGPGWRAGDLPERVVLARSLPEAIELMTAATGR